MNLARRFACVTLALAGGCDLSGVGLPCAGDGNCPASLVCSAGVCVATTGRVVGVPVPGDVDASFGRIVAPPPLSLTSHPTQPSQAPHTIDGPDVAIVPGATPRVLVHSDGTIEVLFAIASCGGVGRWRPLDGFFDVVAEAGQCVDDLDAKISASDVTHVVVREDSDAGSVVVLFTIDAAGNETTPTTIDSPSGGERGMFPRIAIGPDGHAKSAWVTSDSSSTTIETVSPLTSPTSLYGSAGGVAIAIDASGVAAVFFTDDGADYPGLYLDQDGQDRYLASAIDGAIDAVFCGSALDVLHRKGPDVVVDDVASTTNPSVLPHVDEGLIDARVPSDLALSCDQALPWAAYFVLGDDVVRVKRFDGASWAPVADVAAAGPASIAVKDGAFHLAYPDVADHLVYATNP